jgi:hypothetical protein
VKLEDQLGVRLSKTTIRHLLKDFMNLSYKKIYRLDSKVNKVEAK